MEELIIEFVCGLGLIGIITVIMIRQLQKEAVFSKKNKIYINIFSVLILVLILGLSVMKENSDILMGTLIGSSLFQLLAIGGVNKLNRLEEKKISSREFLRKKNDIEYEEEKSKIRYRSNVQYLIFCVIFLLFLSADYLLRGEKIQNMLGRIDGIILILLFVVYLYVMQDGEQKGIIRFLKGHLFKERKEKLVEEHNSKKNLISIIICFLIIGIAIIAGGFLLMESVPKIGIELGITQYVIGVTIMTWCINIPTIISNIIENIQDSDCENSFIEEYQTQNRISGKENNNDFMETVSNKIIFSITFLLGLLVLIRPIRITNYIVYDLIIFGIISLLIQLIEKIDNRLAGSSMATAYIGFIVYILMR